MSNSRLTPRPANPGLPGFAHFGGERFAQSGTLAKTASVRPCGDGCSEYFPAGKPRAFREVEPRSCSQDSAAEARGAQQTFLQESSAPTTPVQVSGLSQWFIEEGASCQ
jgi:hypothetical protein